MPTPSALSAIQKLRVLLTREEKFNWLGIVAFSLCVSLFEVATAAVIIVFAQVLNHPAVGQKYLNRLGFSASLPSETIIFYLAIATGTIYLLKNLIAAAEVFFQNISIQKMNYRFKNKLLDQYSKSSYNFHLTRNSSLGMQVVDDEVETMFSDGVVPFASIFSEGMVFVVLVATAIYINPAVAFMIAIIGIGVGFFLIKFLFPLFYRWGQKFQEASVQNKKSLMQFFHAFKEMILMGKREAFIDAYSVFSKLKSEVHAIQTATNAIPRLGIEVLFVTLFVLTVIYFCLQHADLVQMTGLLAGYLYVGFRLMPGLNRIIYALNTFKSSFPSIERVYAESMVLAAVENHADVPDFSFTEKITLENINFKYLNTEENALSDVNLEIQKGECIAIVGESGAGKSTLLDVILGLLPPCQGSILIDEEYPVNTYQWHRKIGYVPQEVYLVDDTIGANIAFGEKRIDSKKLNEVIESAQLTKFIHHLPEGVNTIVGERGVRLSGGERQRIAIARALYHNPEVLIFDEATSALDHETEAKLIETINVVRRGRTVIMIAHRLTSLKSCNRIIVIDNGKVQQITQYSKLVANSPLVA